MGSQICATLQWCAAPGPVADGGARPIIQCAPVSRLQRASNAATVRRERRTAAKLTRFMQIEREHEFASKPFNSCIYARGT